MTNPAFDQLLFILTHDETEGNIFSTPYGLLKKLATFAEKSFPIKSTFLYTGSTYSVTQLSSTTITMVRALKGAKINGNISTNPFIIWDSFGNFKEIMGQISEYVFPNDGIYYLMKV